VTTKEYHPLPRLDRQTSTYGALTKTFNNKNNLAVTHTYKSILQWHYQARL